jgi:uncharacterized coiled-coil DUF342 family protein
VGAADNKLGLENTSLRKTVGDKEKLITELQTQIEVIRKTAKSSAEEAAGLKALTSEQKKLTAALKERITALETASFLVKTELLQAEQKALEQATKIDGFQTTSTELKQRIVSLETQNKRFEISELETNKQIESLGAEQAVLQEEKEVLFTSNEVLKLENGSLSAKLKKLGSKSLFEGGLSGKSLVFGDDKKDETNSATNSLGGNLISKKLIKDLQDENAEFRQAKVENLEKIEALKTQVQTALNDLAAAKSSIAGLTKEASELSAKITGLQAELRESKTKTQSKVDDLASLEAQLVELQSYKAQVADKESQEIETSKIALKTLFENKKALVLSSASEEAEVKDYISNLIEELGLSPEADTFDVFLASDKTFSITLGLGTQDECNSMRDQLLAFGSIPEDSFCGDWDEYIAAFDFKNGQLLATVGKNYFEEGSLQIETKFDNSELVEIFQTTKENANDVKPKSDSVRKNKSSETAEIQKNTNLDSVFNSDLTKSLAEYYFTLPAIGSKEFLCEYEPGPTYIGNKKIWECRKNEKGYETSISGLYGRQNIGYNKDGSVGFAYALLQSSFPAYTDSWFKNTADAEAFVESIYGKADRRESGESGCLNRVGVFAVECKYIALSYGCNTYYFNTPGSHVKGGAPPTHRNILEEISPVSLIDNILDKDMSFFSREIIKSEVVEKDKCGIATISSWQREGQRMGEEDTTKVSIFVADMQTSFPALEGQW